MNTTKLHINSGTASLQSRVSPLQTPVSAAPHHHLLLINMNEQKVVRTILIGLEISRDLQQQQQQQRHQLLKL